MKFKKETLDKKADVLAYQTDEFSLPLVNAKVGDNGIMFYGRPEDFESAEMTIDVVSNGAIATGDVYSQPQKTGVLWDAYLIKPKFKATPNLLHFFASSIYKSIKPKFGYEYKATWNRVSEEKVLLPLNKSKGIDFDFMEHFIAELEAERIKELEAYLEAAELKDYKLTAEEESALGGGTCAFRTFILYNLFGSSTRGKRLKSADRFPGALPFVTAGEADEGISDFIGNDVEVFSRNTTTIDMFGSAKYRNYEYGGDDHIAVVHTEDVPKLASIYITAAIHKASHDGQFSYSRNFYAKDADALDVQLPARGNEPDYDYMATVISAVQKLVIRDVVLYSEKKIAAAKEVVQSH